MDKKYLSRDVVGKQVVDSNAVIVGNVKDLSFDMVSKTIALIVTTKTGTEITVDSNNINAVGDVVLLKPAEAQLPIEKAPAPPPVEATPVLKPQITPGLCSSCGYQNDANSNFCIKCGTKLR